MKSITHLSFILAALCCSSVQGFAAGQTIEKTTTYAISGSSAPELYISIGQQGPKVGSIGRTIAHTNFTLTWSRKYKTQGNSCVLATAVPKLTITYTLPKPSQKLPAATQKNWDHFLTGITAHERVHGDYIKQMVAKIEDATIGLTTPDDPKCVKIKTDLNQHLGRIFQEQRQRGRDFDREEMSEGGNIHRLVLNFVNSGV